MDYQFPQGFLWGSSTSGPQTEGRYPEDGKGDNLWDRWYVEEPKRFRDSPTQTSGFYEHWKEDIDLLVETGQTAFRTSIQWSRIFPEGDGAVNQAGVDFYRQVFEAIKEKGIQLFVKLYHFDLPISLQDRYKGWTSRQTVLAYEKYAHFCFETFHDLVDYWITFNEPIVPIEFGYFYDAHYPHVVDAKAAVAAAYHYQLASALAIRACHQIQADAKIGIVLNLTPVYPRSQEASDLAAAEVAELFQARSFLDPSVKGVYPDKLIALLKKDGLLPNPGHLWLDHIEEDAQVLKENLVDFLGINYYQPLRVQAPEEGREEEPWMPDRYYQSFLMPGRRVNPHRGWEIYEQGIYDCAMKIKEKYGNIPWFLTENGMGVENEDRFRLDGRIEDDYRIDFLKDHLVALHKAIREGAHCQGFLVWTFIDCWSWLNGYKNRYGLVELDRETGDRRIKKSGFWFKKVSRENGF